MPRLDSLTLVGFPFIEMRLGSEADRIDQYLEAVENELHVSMTVLPIGWRCSRRGAPGSYESASNKTFRTRACEAVESLPILKTLILNRD